MDCHPEAPAVSLIEQALILFARRRYATRVAATEVGPVILLDREDPDGGTAFASPGYPENLLEVSESAGLLALDAAEAGTLLFESAGDLDRFVADLIDRGWEDLRPGDYRTVKPPPR